MEFSGPEPLGVDDMRVLQGLVAMAGPRGRILSSEPSTDEGKQLRAFLDPRWEAMQEDGLVVKGSYADICKAVGWTNKDARQVRACIERLFKVTVIAESNKRRRGYHLLSHIDTDETEARMIVALNPKLTAAIMGSSSHARIELAEVRALATDPARLLHQRICGYIDPGASRLVTLDTLVTYIWPDEAAGATKRMRMSRARKAMAEVGALPEWVVHEYAKGKYEITRPWRGSV